MKELACDYRQHHPHPSCLRISAPIINYSTTIGIPPSPEYSTSTWLDMTGAARLMT